MAAAADQSAKVRAWWSGVGWRTMVKSGCRVAGMVGGDRRGAFGCVATFRLICCVRMRYNICNYYRIRFHAVCSSHHVCILSHQSVSNFPVRAYVIGCGLASNPEP